MNNRIVPRIVGVGETQIGKHPTHTTESLASLVGGRALNESGRNWNDVDGLIVTEPIVGRRPRYALTTAENLGISQNLRVARTVAMGGASPALAVKEAFNEVGAGNARNVLVISTDTPRTGQLRSETVKYFSKQRNPSWERPIGMMNVTAYALLADQYLADNRLHEDALVNIPVVLRKHASKNKNAAYTESMTYEDALNSRRISDPLRMVECSPINDGGAAILVSSEPGIENTPEVAVAGFGFGTDYDSYTYRTEPTETATARSASKAVQQSGRSVIGGDLLMIYDSYSIAMAMQLEALNIAKRGQAPQDFEAERFGINGDLAVNPHGGLLSHGHCGGAAGIHHITEMIRQLRGTADNQVPIENGYGYYQSEGGILSANASLCFEIL